MLSFLHVLASNCKSMQTFPKVLRSIKDFISLWERLCFSIDICRLFKSSQPFSFQTIFSKLKSKHGQQNNLFSLAFPVNHFFLFVPVSLKMSNTLLVGAS